EENFLEGSEAAMFIKKMIDNSDDLSAALKELNGVFVFVYEKSNRTIMCCDRTRTFPLFYYSDDEQLSISDNPDMIEVPSKDIDDDSLKLFLFSGYVPGNKTLLKEVLQVQAGEFVVFDKNGSQNQFYHKYKASEYRNDEENLKAELKNIFLSAGKRLKSSLEGKIPVLPLSSGYDSRLIACLLKMNGFDDVLTFTYGRKNNYELEISRKTAEILGYRWMNILYDDETVRDFLQSEDFNRYYPGSSNYTSMFYLQEFFAVGNLKSVLPENALFLPGHSGDSVAGSHIKESMFVDFSKDELIDHIIKSHFNYRKPSAKDISFIKEKLSGILPDKSRYSHNDYQNWILKERHGKMIINSNRIYEYFNFGFRMPLVDSEFVDLFENVSPELKLGKKFYDSVLKEYFFDPLGLNFENETNASAADIKLQTAKNSIKNILPKSVVNYYREKVRANSDTFFNIGVTDEMIKDMKASGVEPDMTGENRNSILIQWYVQQLINKRF
ncbi:MAG: asparagine synthase C-terminal domain-containing protein, partial [Candidatus Delongbacteria bacterium]